MNRKNLIVIFLIILGAGLFFYSNVIVEERIFNIFLHNPNELLVNVPLQMLLKKEQSLQAFTEILGYSSGAAGLIVLFTGILSKRSKDSRTNA